MEQTRASRRQAAARPRPRRRVSIIGVFGELLITAGVLVMLYVVWQLWVGDLIYGAQNNAAAEELSQTWAEQYTPPEPDGEVLPPEEPASVEPVILPEPADTEVFGIMRVPRFGDDYAVQMAGGVTRAGTLDTIGIGH